MKKLESGIEVDSDKYYQLLEWKDNNMQKFIWWCKEYGIWLTNNMSINKFDKAQYDALLDFANIS